MDQDIDGLQTNGAAERKKEYFSVRMTFSGTSQEFKDPRLAGEAFFRADPAERPTVTHVDGNTARTMARTELHGQHEGGEARYFKSLPDSHAPDAEFRAGFLAAMEASISERLQRVTHGRDGANVVERLDAGLQDDLEAFARREPDKAASLWSDRTEEPAPGPILQAAVKAREGVLEADAQVGQVVTAEKPQVVATGDWVTTDQSVELRPVVSRPTGGCMPGSRQGCRKERRRSASRTGPLPPAWMPCVTPGISTKAAKRGSRLPSAGPRPWIATRATMLTAGRRASCSNIANSRKSPARKPRSTRAKKPNWS